MGLVSDMFEGTDDLKLSYVGSRDPQSGSLTGDLTGALFEAIASLEQRARLLDRDMEDDRVYHLWAAEGLFGYDAAKEAARHARHERERARLHAAILRYRFHIIGVRRSSAAHLRPAPHLA